MSRTRECQSRAVHLVLALLLVLSFSLVYTTPAAAQSTWYVATTGDDIAGDGSEGAPWATIQHAIGQASSGDTIMVAAGTYQESMGGWRDIEIFKSLSILGAGSGATIVELSNKGNGVEIRPDATGVVLIEGITFTKMAANPSSAGFALRIGETGGTFASLTFRDVEVAWASGRNVFFDNGGAGTSYDEIIVEDCNIHHSGAWGMSLRGTVGTVTVTNSHFDDNGWSTPSHGIGFDLDMPVIMNALTVTGGTFNNNTSKGINMVKTRNATFIGITASNNAGAPGGGFGVSLWEWSGTSENLAFDNPVLKDNATDGFLIGSETGKTVRNVSITCGTLSGNGRAGLFVYRAAGWGEGVIEDVVIGRSSITGNTQWGVGVVMAYEPVDARHNWWGDNSGPAGSGPGVGDSVSNDVLFDPWMRNAIPTQTATGIASFVTSDGSIGNLAAEAVPGGAPAGVTFPHGMFSFEVCCVDPGQSVTLTVTLPRPVPVGTRWWKHQNGHWYWLPNETDDGDNIMTITLTDGGPGDADGVADGIITDPGGPGVPPVPPTAGSAYPVWIVLLAGLMAGASLLLLRRRWASI